MNYSGRRLPASFDLEIRYWLEIIHKYGFMCVNGGTRDRYRENRLCARRQAEIISRYRGIAGYGFYILIIAYPLISFRPVNRSPKNPRIKLALSETADGRPEAQGMAGARG